MFEFTSSDGSLVAKVVEVPGGYAISIRDVEAGEVVPTVVTYPDRDRAVAYAKKCVAF